MAVADPWAPVSAAPPAGASPWGSPPPQNGMNANGESTLDDAFDLLSSRKPEPLKNGNGEIGELINVYKVHCG